MKLALKALALFVLLAVPSAGGLMAEAKWKLYALPANLQISIPENWREQSATEQSQVEGVEEGIVLFLVADDTTGVRMANITVKEISGVGLPAEGALRSQEMLGAVMDDSAAAGRLLEAHDAATQKLVEGEMAIMGVSMQWLGSEITRVGDLWAFVSKYEWILPAKYGQESFSVTEVKIWNQGSSCLIRVQYSNSFPSMASLSERMLGTLSYGTPQEKASP